MSENPDTAGAKPVIEYDDFAKLDLRVGTVREAGDHPNADRLIVLKVDLGDQQRQIIAGLKAWVDPASLVGKQIVVVANLAPRKMRGLESQGMLLAASDMSSGNELPDNVVPLGPHTEVPAGSRVS
jgi:tRNA-binding protein